MIVKDNLKTLLPIRIEIFKVDLIDFTDSEAELVHQGVNGLVTDAEDGIGIDGFKQKLDLARR